MFWKVRAMPSLVISCRFLPTSVWPWNRICPSVGAKTPVMALKAVVFPAPFGPIRPRISPL